MTPLAFGFGGPTDLMIVAVVVLLLFGGSKLSGFGKSLGEGIREFKKATHEEEETLAPVRSADRQVPPKADDPVVVTGTKGDEK